MARVLPAHPEGVIPGTETALPSEHDKQERFEYYRAKAEKVMSLDADCACAPFSFPFDEHEWPRNQPAMPQRVKLPEHDENDEWGHPQWREVWPQEWGITLQQCRNLMAAVRSSTEHSWSSDYSVEDLVRFYIKPWTAGTGLGYSLLANYHAPKEVNVMVSHAWKENAQDFFGTLERSCSEDDVMYICFLANYQHNDGYGPNVVQQLGSEPSESPFFRVLKTIETRGCASGGGFTLGWRQRKKWQNLCYAWLTGAMVLWCPAVVLEGCIPSFSTCYSLVTLFGLSVTLLLYTPLVNKYSVQVNTHHPWGHWEYRTLPSGFVPLIAVALVLAVAGLVLLLAIEYGKRGFFYNGRMLAVPCRETDLYSRSIPLAIRYSLLTTDCGAVSDWFR